ncbi:MAG: hypothetical protein D6714_20375 [Bacteroidetes bacterium]|nr:MAG: hypothetical protein D6714_20375 [Bacteroidota bacterium]
MEWVFMEKTPKIKQHRAKSETIPTLLGKLFPPFSRFSINTPGKMAQLEYICALSGKGILGKINENSGGAPGSIPNPTLPYPVLKCFFT